MQSGPPLPLVPHRVKVITRQPSAYRRAAFEKSIHGTFPRGLRAGKVPCYGRLKIPQCARQPPAVQAASSSSEAPAARSAAPGEPLAARPRTATIGRHSRCGVRSTIAGKVYWASTDIQVFLDEQVPNAFRFLPEDCASPSKIREIAYGTDGRAFPWGNHAPTDNICWGIHGGWARGRTSTCPVGSFPQSRSLSGLEDMAGNVWEWTASPWNPKSTLPNEPRIVRGGGYNTFIFTYIMGPSALYPSQQKRAVGFRCARD